MHGGIAMARLLSLPTNRVALLIHHAPPPLNDVYRNSTMADKTNYHHFLLAVGALAAGVWSAMRFSMFVSTPESVCDHCTRLGAGLSTPLPEYRPLLTEQYSGNESNADVDANANAAAFAGHHHRIWFIRPKFKAVTTIPLAALQRLSNYSSWLVDSIVPKKVMDGTRGHGGSDERLARILRQAVLALQQQHSTRSQPHQHDYANDQSATHQALSLHALRPNADVQRQLDKVLSDIVPSDWNPDGTYGMPIRASDNCNAESDCLSLEQHVQVANLLWKRHEHMRRASRDYNYTHDENKAKPTILFNTESRDVVREQEEYLAAASTESLGYFDRRVIRNTRDVLPDTGRFSYKSGHNNQSLGAAATADPIVLSALVSLKLQLYARLTGANCCSNFHTLLGHFFHAGCGASKQNDFVCLQNMRDPELRICCRWRANCIQTKQRQIKMLQRQRWFNGIVHVANE